MDKDQEATWDKLIYTEEKAIKFLEDRGWVVSHTLPVTINITGDIDQADRGALAVDIATAITK